MFSALDLCSQALLKIGASPIHAFDAKTAESKIATALYESVKQNILSSFPWTFAIKTERLAKLSIDPEADFSHAFQIPNECLCVLSVGMNEKSTGLSYQIKGTQLLTTANDVYATYLRDVSESELPPFFRQALVSRLASEFCLPLTENTTLANFLLKQAEMDEKKARVIDSQQETPRAILNFPMVDIRG